jgi:soluble lytic murein transglycosylase-like protein
MPMTDDLKQETVIMKSDHLKIVRRIKKRVWIGHLVWALVVCILLVSPYILKFERDLFAEAYKTAKMEFDSVLIRQELLVMLRSKTLSIGQALDIADVVLSQKDVPVPIILGIISQESDFRAEAISPKGARGLMGVMPATFKSYSANPFLSGPRQIHDPILNMKAGLSYLGDMKRIYGTWRMALRSYFAGSQNAKNKDFDWYVDAVIEKSKRYERR